MLADLDLLLIYVFCVPDDLLPEGAGSDGTPTGRVAQPEEMPAI